MRDRCQSIDSVLSTYLSEPAAGKLLGDWFIF